MRSALKDKFLIFLSHTTQYADHLIRSRKFTVFQPTEGRVNLVLGVFADATGVKQNRISFADIVRQAVAFFAQCPNDQFAVEHIHLTADRLDKEFSVVVCHFNLSLVLRTHPPETFKDNISH